MRAHLLISLLLFSAGVARPQSYCRSCADSVILNLTKVAEPNTVFSDLLKLAIESLALLSRDCSDPEWKTLEVEAEEDCFHLTANGAAIPNGTVAQIFGPLSFFDNTTLLDIFNFPVDRNVSTFSTTYLENGTHIWLRVFNNTTVDASANASAGHILLRLVLIVLGVTVVLGLVAAFTYYERFMCKKKAPMPPYLRYEDRIRVGLEPVATEESAPAESSSGVLLVSYVRHNEAISIADEDGNELRAAPSLPKAAAPELMVPDADAPILNLEEVTNN